MNQAAKKRVSPPFWFPSSTLLLTSWAAGSGALPALPPEKK